MSFTNTRPKISVVKQEIINTVKEESISHEQTKEEIYSSPIIMDAYGQTPDHFYLARKPPSHSQAKRKLELHNKEIPIESESKPTKHRRKLETIPLQPKEPKAQKVAAEKRCDTSLGQLTKNFLTLLSDATDGIINLNTACHLLSVPKRRLYDITNVLEGAGLIQKTSRNNIQWMGRISSPSANNAEFDLEKEIDILDAKENKLDELIYHMKSEINALKEANGKYHYITTDDLKDIKEFSKRLLLGVTIPSSGQLVEIFEKKVVFNSKTSEIEAFLFAEDMSFKNILHPKAECKENSYHIKVSDPSLSYESNEGSDTGNPVEPYENLCTSLYTRTHFTNRWKEDTKSPVEPYENLCTSLYTRTHFTNRWKEGVPDFIKAFVINDEFAPICTNFLFETEDQYNISPDLESYDDNKSFSSDDGENFRAACVCHFARKNINTKSPVEPYENLCTSLYTRTHFTNRWKEGVPDFIKALIINDDDFSPIGTNFLFETEDQYNISPDLESYDDNKSFSSDDGESFRAACVCHFPGENISDAVFKNAFITEDDDIGPIGRNFLLQTEDQDLDSLPDLEFHVDNYSFSLDDGEGLTDLFDCHFAGKY